MVVIGILNRGANNANEGVACVPGMLPGMADKSELDLGDASLGLPRLPKVPEVAAITAGSSPPPSERDSQVSSFCASPSSRYTAAGERQGELDCGCDVRYRVCRRYRHTPRAHGLVTNPNIHWLVARGQRPRGATASTLASIRKTTLPPFPTPPHYPTKSLTQVESGGLIRGRLNTLPASIHARRPYVALRL